MKDENNKLTAAGIKSKRTDLIGDEKRALETELMRIWLGERREGECSSSMCVMKHFAWNFVGKLGVKERFWYENGGRNNGVYIEGIECWLTMEMKADMKSFTNWILFLAGVPLFSSLPYWTLHLF